MVDKALLIYFVLLLGSVQTGHVSFDLADLFSVESSAEDQSFWGRAWLEKFDSVVPSWLREEAKVEESEDQIANEYPYFRFIPEIMAHARVGMPEKTWNNRCFQDNSVRLISKLRDRITLSFTTANKTSLLCSDSYVFMTPTNLELHTFFTSGTHKVSVAIPKKATQAHRNDIDNRGVCIGRILISATKALWSLKKTVSMFLQPMVQKHVSKGTAKANVEFLQKYAHFKMEPLAKEVTYTPDPKEVKSGDVFGGLRLDGLDPMLAWAMGSTTGHTTVALWIDGELYVTESTAKDSYWPTDGIQKTPWKAWLEQVRAANYNFMWMPLKDELAAKFNATSAVETMKEYEGMPYGFKNMLFSWLDTGKGNLPCVPPEFEYCLEVEVLQVLLGYADWMTSGKTSNLLLNEAFNKRLGTEGLSLMEVYDLIAKRGMSFTELINIPEQDEWKYSDGYGRMCDAWVCTLLKSGGIFGDMAGKFQCTEMTNWDLTALDLFKKQVQISGTHTYSVGGMNAKPWAPYPHYAENCTSLAPDYAKDKYC